MQTNSNGDGARFNSSSSSRARIPSLLAERPHWILWRNENGRKVPYQPSGQRAKSNTPSTWSTLGEVLAANEGDSYTGVGYMFTDDDDLVGIDLDYCILPNGDLTDWAADILQTVDSYAEVSPSGKGIKIWVRAPGVVPTINTKKFDRPEGWQKGDHEPAIEVFVRGRYFAFTGQRLQECPDQVRTCTDQVRAILVKYGLIVEEPKPARQSAPVDPSEDRAAEFAAKVSWEFLLKSAGWKTATLGPAC